MALSDFVVPDSGGMDNTDESSEIFGMGSLRTHLPQKRGLSKYFSGKSRSFQCIAEAKCVEDLKKMEPLRSAKKRRKSIVPHPIPAVGNYIFNSGEVRGRGVLRIYCIHIGTASTEITVDQMAEHPLQDHLHVETDLRVKCPGGGTREALVRQGDDKEGGTDVAKLEIEAGEREGSVR
ncbi:hypothetical protein QJS10_CPA06g01899 [Acorus calamus]|uniref:Uncharacterized protein n=1 Tax=Acorus calamus TaxID=4465 RepID=A0AAV9EN97_ACOCL|nr:hypothetical protein QJS10_CPA06g01899 [Acorus calamus]